MSHFENNLEEKDMDKEEKYWEEYFDRLEYDEILKKGFTNMDFETWQRCKDIPAGTIVFHKTEWVKKEEEDE